jgi:hypothetical protein
MMLHFTGEGEQHASSAKWFELLGRIPHAGHGSLTDIKVCGSCVAQNFSALNVLVGALALSVSVGEVMM